MRSWLPERPGSSRWPRQPWPTSMRRWGSAEGQPMTEPDRQERREPANDGRVSTVAEAAGDLGRILGRDPRWFGALLVSVTVIAVYFAITVVGSAIFAFGDIVLIFFLAWLIAFIVSPFASALKRLVRPLPQAASVLLVYIVAIGALLLAIFVVAANLASSISQFVQSIPQIEQNLGQYLAPWQDRLNGLGLSVDLSID